MRIGHVVYDVSNFQKDLLREAKDARKDTKKALKAAANVLERALKITTPNSLRSGRTSKVSSLRNRKKWGILRNALGTYDTKQSRLKSNEVEGVNVGYLKSKQLKYFVARFLDTGAFNKRSGKFEKYYEGYVRRTEKLAAPLIKSTFDQNLDILISNRISKIANKWTR
jgi:hypothetical protein